MSVPSFLLDKGDRECRKILAFLFLDKSCNENSFTWSTVAHGSAVLSQVEGKLVAHIYNWGKGYCFFFLYFLYF